MLQKVLQQPNLYPTIFMFLKLAIYKNENVENVKYLTGKWNVSIIAMVFGSRLLFYLCSWKETYLIKKLGSKGGGRGIQNGHFGPHGLSSGI